jgi:hypothetical protein
VTGWPTKQLDLPEAVKPYYTFREQLAVLDGILYRRARLIVPKSVRPEILRKLQISHQGTTATVRQARSAVFWPQMSEDIRAQTERYVTCAMDAPAQTRKTLHNHDIPCKPWSKVGMDIFTHKKNDYLILVDYFSDFFNYEQLSDLESRSVIDACGMTFSRYGAPHQLQSDNGVQFTSAEFASFCKE